MDQCKEYGVQELLELAHKYKCLRIKTGPIEVELSPAAFSTPGTAPELLDLNGGEKVPTPEEFMFMAGLQVESEDQDGAVKAKG